MCAITLQAIKTIEEPKYTCDELAKVYKLHSSTVRKIFMDEEGVVRLGRSGTGKNANTSHCEYHSP